MAVARIDMHALQALIMQEPLAIAGKSFGDVGSTRLKSILRFLKKCARHSIVTEKTELLVFSIIQTKPQINELRLKHASAFQFGITALGTIDHLVVEIREDGTPFVWSTMPPELEPTIPQGLAYKILQSVETFIVAETNLPVGKVVDGAISQFFLNHFADLKDALIAYRDSMARTSKCHLLREAWADDNRLWFTTTPEYKLRRALCNYLVSYLRHDDIDLRPEQNVDESHPVDIKIVWRMENRSAIIEIKWLGKSLDLETRSITAKYYDQRARDGAKQLAEYLEAHKQEASKEDTRGYLVVFDCRRNGLSSSDTKVTKSAGLHYKDAEIKYDPEYHLQRSDFEEPIRMFLEPVCV